MYKRFVIQLESYFNISKYFTGEVYVFQGETYAVFNNDINKAKKYKHRKVAQDVAERLNNTAININKAKVKEIQV